VVAVQQSVPGLAKDVTVGFITAENAQTDAVPIGSVPSNDPTLPWLQIRYKRAACDSNSVTIEKDGALVFGQDLLTTENDNAFLQVSLGAATGDTMSLQPSDYPGKYKITFILVKDNVTTTIASTATYEVGAWTVGKTFIYAFGAHHRHTHSRIGL
jgi:hypothetical protein